MTQSFIGLITDHLNKQIFIFNDDLAKTYLPILLFGAAVFGYEQCINWAILHKVNLDPVQLDGASPLLLALRSGNQNIARLLIKNNADIALKDKDGINALMQATSVLDYDNCAFILDKASNDGVCMVDYVNCQDNCGETVLHKIAKNGDHCDLETLKQFINLGADIKCQNKASQTVLHIVAALCNDDILQYILGLLDQRQPDYSNYINQTDENGASALYLAFLNRRSDNIIRLMKAGAKLVNSTNSAQTELHLAVFHADLKVVQYCVEHCKHLVNAVDKDGNTPLHIALRRSAQDKESNIKIVDMLVKAGADIAQKTANGENILHLAIEVNTFFELKKCIANIEDLVNVIDAKGNSPLLLAVKAGKENIVEDLIKLGADVNVCNKDGKNAIDINNARPCKAASKKIKHLLQHAQKHPATKVDIAQTEHVDSMVSSEIFDH